MRPAAPTGLAAAQLVAALLRSRPDRYAGVRVERLSPYDSWLGVATLSATVLVDDYSLKTCVAVGTEDEARAISDHLHRCAMEIHQAWQAPDRN
ncbi:hypothetical protein [Paludisphaera rhizosphaerae]|uniref:hypothetical protein n=1 Tax=Paludisphaera rhizosphaerae TaxID=2711216 RepID=UPI0013EACF1A|nr:hypothetical protein [Paludisphaera rhizosphaerae]